MIASRAAAGRVFAHVHSKSPGQQVQASLQHAHMRLNSRQHDLVAAVVCVRRDVGTQTNVFTKTVCSAETNFVQCHSQSCMIGQCRHGLSESLWILFRDDDGNLHQLGGAEQEADSPNHFVAAVDRRNQFLLNVNDQQAGSSAIQNFRTAKEC